MFITYVIVLREGLHIYNNNVYNINNDKNISVHQNPVMKKFFISIRDIQLVIEASRQKHTSSLYESKFRQHAACAEATGPTNRAVIKQPQMY